MQAVEPRSPAARAGLADGDLLVRLADQPVGGIDELHRILRTQPAHVAIAAVVIRRGLRLELAITPSWSA